MSSEGLTSYKESFDKFWSDEKKQVAQLCEDKGHRLFWDNLQAIYFVVRIFKDGSILHTKDTEVFSADNIAKVREYIATTTPLPDNAVISRVPFDGNAYGIAAQGRALYHAEVTTLEQYNAMKGEPHEILSFEEFGNRKNSRYTTKFREITEEQWYDALECLPPENWYWINEDVNIFTMCEYYTGTVSGRYLKIKSTGKFYSCTMDVFANGDEVLEKFKADTAA